MVIEASKEFVPVFIDTLNDIQTTKRFQEKYGSYPVLRIHNLDGQDIAGRINGNLVAGRIPVVQVLKQLHYGKNVFAQQLLRMQQLELRAQERADRQGNQTSQLRKR